MDWTGTPGALAALLAAIASLALLIAGVVALRRRRFASGAFGTLLGLLLASLAALFATFTLAIQGYRAFTHEELAATVFATPIGPQVFDVDIEYPDGHREHFTLHGDQLYVDARILKWQPWANLVGLHTAYELDRIAGRYERIDDERDRPRSIHSLAAERPLDIFSLRQSHAWLAPLLDAEYGSATFTSVRRPAQYRVSVSTTGLLVREIDADD